MKNARPDASDTAEFAAVARDLSADAAAHDFNNLLTAMIGAAAAALDRIGLDAETRADLEAIHRAARRGIGLVRHLRYRPTAAPDEADMPRATMGTNETIRGISRLLSHGWPAVAFTLELTEPETQIAMDPAQLDRILMNLIINARQAMPEGGRVTLRTGARHVEHAARCHPDVVPPGDYGVITIADTGIGIPDAIKAHVFEAGFTTRRDNGGTGLGLATVRALVRDAAGFLNLQSAAGQGTSVEIYLPMVTRPAAPPAADGPPTLARGRAVLVVEDDELVRRIAERALRRAGWTVHTAGSADIALTLLESEAVDLVLTDVEMPGMDGIALARLVLARSPLVPVILTSGYAIGMAEAGLPPSRVSCLTKPYDPAALLAMVARSAGG